MIQALEEGNLPGVARRLFNVFEEVLPPRKRGQVEELKGEMLHRGALGASMSGTGPTVFGLFEREEEARGAEGELKKLCKEVYLVRTI